MTELSISYICPEPKCDATAEVSDVLNNYHDSEGETAAFVHVACSGIRQHTFARLPVELLEISVAEIPFDN